MKLPRFPFSRSKEKKKLVNPFVDTLNELKFSTPKKKQLKELIQHYLNVWYNGFMSHLRNGTGMAPSPYSKVYGYTTSLGLDKSEINTGDRELNNHYKLLFDALNNNADKVDVIEHMRNLYNLIDNTTTSDEVISRYGDNFLDVLVRAEIRYHPIWNDQRIQKSDMDEGGYGGMRKTKNKRRKQKRKTKRSKRRNNKSNKRKTKRSKRRNNK